MSRRVVDTWYFSHPALETKLEPKDDEESPLDTLVKERKVPVTVVLEKTLDGQTPPLSVTKAIFTLECKDPEITITGTDIEALRKAMWAQLDAHYEIKWERWYAIDLVPEPPWRGQGRGLSFAYRSIERGVAWNCPGKTRNTPLSLVHVAHGSRCRGGKHANRAKPTATDHNQTATPSRHARHPRAGGGTGDIPKGHRQPPSPGASAGRACRRLSPELDAPRHLRP